MPSRFDASRYFFEKELQSDTYCDKAASFIYVYIYIYIYIYFCIKNAINTNCLGIDDPFLLNKKDLQGVISNI